MTKTDERATWDGLPVSPEPPYGATIIVRRQGDLEHRYLLLHRSGAGDQGEWAWTPPSGARLPSEPINECAKRELLEETALVIEPTFVDIGTEDWPVYLVEVRRECQITLSPEHDRFEWVTIDQAFARCKPERVAAPFRRLKDLEYEEDR